MKRQQFLIYIIIISTIFLSCENKVIPYPQPIDIDNHRQLFVDEFLIQKFKGSAKLKLHKPRPEQIVMIHDEPWEGNTCTYHTIFKDDSIYRMYYRASNHKNDSIKTHPSFTCYAESSDGIHWKKPNLDIHKYNGSKKNNIILKGIGTHNFTPFKDNNPKCKSNEKYKAISSGNGGLIAWKSSDGIHWKLMRKDPIITEGKFDSQNIAFWDSVNNVYHCYFRDFKNGYRNIKTSISKNFLEWRDPIWLDIPNASKEHLYTNQIRPYYRAPHIFIGFPSRFNKNRGNLVEPLFMNSRDGTTFHLWKESIIRPGRNLDRWKDRSNYVWWGLAETFSNLPGTPKELSLYTNERYYTEKSVKIRRYTYRIDGFVSIHASYNKGEIITKPIYFQGTKLKLNFSTSIKGWVKVEIQTINGKSINGYTIQKCSEIYGDAIGKVVSWEKGSSLNNINNEPIRIRFILKDADIYSFKFCE